jgi:hypothetical protein
LNETASLVVALLVCHAAMLLNRDGWAKAADCWDAARRARYVDGGRLYEEIAELARTIGIRVRDGRAGALGAPENEC